jgi:hypothetical protein
MNLNKAFLTFIGFALIILSFSACQEDFNSVGSDIINDPNFEFDLYDEATVVAYSRRAHPVQTNNLPVYQLGVYNDPVFGRTEASILAQVTMQQTNPSFGENPEIERVILSIPYFSTSTGTGEDTTYTLDSIYGNSPIKLSIFESKFFLRDLDPNSGFSEPQKYYSNQGPLFQNFLGELLYETSLESPFMPTNDPETINEGTDDEEKLSPRFRVELDGVALDFFKEKIFDQEGSDVLLNNTNFKNHFRGIYFIAEALGDQGNTILLDMARPTIEIIYSRDDPNPGGGNRSTRDEAERIESSFILNFNGIRVNTFKNNMPPELEKLLNNPSSAGAENLYVKGGAGTVTVIELFGKDLDGNNVADELDYLRSKKWLINEANLTVQVNKNAVNGGSSEPERLFLYDLNNNTVLIDYQLDNYTPAGIPIDFKTNHLGRIQRDASGNGETYRFRITSHISNLINKDSTNVRLGLVVSPNITVLTNQDLQNVTSPGIKKIPTSNIISPEGTVIYGSNHPDPDKRIRLNIYYTEINN